MNAEHTANIAIAAGWVYYDGTCPLCCASARRFAPLLARRRIHLHPLQSPEASQRLGLRGPALLREMRLLLADGRLLGGAEAVIELARRIWWAWPLWLISHVPGVRPLLRVGYRVVATNRHCLGGLCGRRHRHTAFLELP